ncbi:MAG: hypothetical protein Q7R49_04165 [Candidatus Daviesbacteria bacterium]|nr:hypothetical protein [Candidatus Daviesbacteria bacterium]
MDNLALYRFKEKLFAHKTTAIFVLAIVLLLGGGVFASQAIFNKSNQQVGSEINISFDPEGAYALLYPRADGNALVLDLKRTTSYDAISYELAYTSLPDTTSSSKITMDEGNSGSIDRGVVGNIDVSERRGEYEQEILFGTCSKNVCKYDKGVENGTLTLHIRKGNKAYRMITTWHLQKPDIALGNLVSGDTHFNYQISDKASLINTGFSIINDLTGAPKLPNDKQVLGTVYGLSVPIAKTLPTGNVTLELAQNPPADAKLYKFNDSTSNWEELGTKIDGSTLSTSANGAGIFAVLTNKK